MKAYKVFAIILDMDGRPHGSEIIGYALSKEKAEAIAKEWTEKNEVNQWWVAYQKNSQGHIDVRIIELEAV